MAIAKLPQYLTLRAGTDFGCKVYLQELGDDGEMFDVQEGNIVGYFSAKETVGDAAEANAAFAVVCAWTGVLGWWNVTCDAVPLTAAALKSTFPSGECFLFVMDDENLKGSVKCQIKYTNPMEVV